MVLSLPSLPLPPPTVSVSQGGIDIPMFMQLSRLESKEHFLGMLPEGMSATIVCIEQVGVGRVPVWRAGNFCLRVCDPALLLPV